jgi:hypothetical protein
VVAVSRKIAALATVLAGCLSVPPYEPAVSVSYTESGQGGTAAGPGFALHFADGTGFHFPDALKIDGTDVMGHEPAPSCYEADEAGIVFSPTHRISAHSGAIPVTNHLVPVLRGPAVVQVKLDWATRFDCDTTRTPGGTAIFTVFPDGRIVRHDAVVDPSMSQLFPDPCSCDPKASPEVRTQFTITPFWTFAQNRFAQLYAPGMRGFPVPGEVITNMSTSCLDGGGNGGGNGYQVAFGWREKKDMTILSGDTAIRFGRDLVSNAQMLDKVLLKNRSAMFIGRTGCDAGVARAVEYVLASCSPTARLACLSINGADTAPADLDGIYGGDSGIDPPGIAVGMGPTTLTGALGGSFAVWLRFPSAVSAVRAKLANAKGAWYLPQQVDDRSWIIWFRDSLSANQMITVEPR